MEYRARILLVDDDYNLGIITKRRLEQHGFEVVFAYDGAMGWVEFNRQKFHICLLDIMMPKKNGFELAQMIRTKNDLVPILFLTSKTQDEDRIRGFKHGGDDYITKPYNIEELVLRIEVFLKRSRRNMEDENFKFDIGNYHFNYTDMHLTDTKANTVRVLTKRETDLIRFLCLRPNKIIKREEILYHVWGKDDYFLGRSMDVFMTKLRKFFVNDKRVQLQTLHGVGYKFIIPSNNKNLK